MAKKAKWKYKHLSEEKFEEYREMSKDGLIEAIKHQSSYLEESVKEKKGSALLKELRKEIADYRKIWADQHPEEAGEIESLQASLKEAKDDRDAKIEEDLNEKKDLEGSFNDR